ncbi:hypothetical protein V8E36_000553 [Tilletia maclaganii]
MTPDASMLSQIVQPASVPYVQVADGTLLEAAGSGTVHLSARHGKSIQRATLSNVLLVPDLKVCLLSVPALQRLGLSVTFHKTGATIQDQSGNKLSATMDIEAGVSTLRSDTSKCSSPIAMALLSGADDGSRPIPIDESEGTRTVESRSTADRREDDQIQQAAREAAKPPAGSSGLDTLGSMP